MWSRSPFAKDPHRGLDEGLLCPSSLRFPGRYSPLDLPEPGVLLALALDWTAVALLLPLTGGTVITCSLVVERREQLVDRVVAVATRQLGRRVSAIRQLARKLVDDVVFGQDVRD